MKREDLEKQGLTKEQIDFVMGENGKDIENVKGDIQTKDARITTLETQLSEANIKIESFKDVDVTDIKQQISDYKLKFEEAKSKAEQDIETLKFEHELESIARDLSAKNVKSVIALIDKENLRGSDNRKEVIKQALESIKTENDFLFGEIESVGTGGSTGNGGKQTLPTDKVNYGQTLAKSNAVANLDTSAYEI